MTLAPRPAAILSMFFAMCVTSVSSSRRRRGFSQRKTDLQVIAIDHQPDSALSCVAAHAVQELPQRFGVLFEQCSLV